MCAAFMEVKLAVVARGRNGDDDGDIDNDGDGGVDDNDDDDVENNDDVDDEREDDNNADEFEASDIESSLRCAWLYVCGCCCCCSSMPHICTMCVRPCTNIDEWPFAGVVLLPLCWCCCCGRVCSGCRPLTIAVGVDAVMDA